MIESRSSFPWGFASDWDRSKSDTQFGIMSLGRCSLITITPARSQVVMSQIHASQALSGADIYFHRLLKYFSLSSWAPMVVAEDVSRNFFSPCLRYRLPVFQPLWVFYFATSASVHTARGSHCTEITTPFKFQRDNSDIALTNWYEFEVLYELADNESR